MENLWERASETALIFYFLIFYFMERPAQHPVNEGIKNPPPSFYPHLEQYFDDPELGRLMMRFAGVLHEAHGTPRDAEKFKN